MTFRICGRLHYAENSAEKKICSRVKRARAILLASGAIGNLIDRLARRITW
ncbi:MAG: hypothetical protein ACLRMN_10155 [Mediterraneibacter gnavus]